MKIIARCCRASSRRRRLASITPFAGKGALLGQVLSERQIRTSQKENQMRFSLRQLICIAATGAISLGVQAQAPSTTATPLNSDNSNARVQADYQAAVKACGAMAGAAKVSCLRDARDALTRDSSSNAGASSSGGLGAGGNAGTRPTPISKN
jgi:hypothetical protein